MAGGRVAERQTGAVPTNRPHLIRGSWDNKFSGIGHTAATSQMRLFDEYLHGLPYGIDDPQCRFRIILEHRVALVNSLGRLPDGASAVLPAATAVNGLPPLSSQ